jgi:uncharacterized coiled-coil protein SlyX
LIEANVSMLDTSVGIVQLIYIMSDAELITELQTKLTYLERHISEQDAEFYRLSQRVDYLNKLLQLQQVQLRAISSGGSSGVDEMPADEKPPHY